MYNQNKIYVENIEINFGANYVLPNHTNIEHYIIDAFVYPGNDLIQIFRRYSAVEKELNELTVHSRSRLHDSWLSIPYGQCWESPGYINRLMCLNNTNNVTRLNDFAATHNVFINWLTPAEYIQSYRLVYEKPFPEGVSRLDPSYDYYTVQRLRHLVLFKRDELNLNPKDKSFIGGIGKILNVGHPITQRQREYIIGIFTKYYNDQSQHLGPKYSHVKVNDSFRFPF